jgi:murein DD-endopeptidase MepM/ murein hydrolase activator NlpD
MDKLIHEVKSGETVSTIAASYGLKTSTVLWENGISDKGSLKIGQKLLVPPVDGVSHKVAKGEDVSKISKAYGVDAAAVMKQNKLVATNLTVGQQIFIPGAKPIVVDAPVIPNRVAVNRAGTTSGRYVISDASIGNGGAILPANDDKPVGAKPFIYPTRGGVTQGFHAGHYAFDIADRSQPPIWAAGSGKVVKAVTGCARVSIGCGGGYGNHVIIDHGNGLQTLYGHMEYINVTLGQQVAQGEFIGKMGRTGNVRGITGIHLHFEVRKNGVKQVPSNYF